MNYLLGYDEIHTTKHIIEECHMTRIERRITKMHKCCTETVNWTKSLTYTTSLTHSSWTSK